jgi:polysaccharide biosynthesis transport protein
MKERPAPLHALEIANRLVRGILRRHKRLAGICALLASVIFMPAAYFSSEQPPRFMTSAVVLLEARPDRVPLFQEFSPSRPLPVQLAILQSRNLAEIVLDQLPRASFRDLTEHPYRVDYRAALKNRYLRLIGREPEVESPQRRALAELQKARMTFDLSRDGIVTISAQASTPQVSIDLVNTYVEVLLSRTRSFNVDDARVTREFLEQQVAEVKKGVESSEEGLRAFVTTHGGIKLPEQSQAVVTQLSLTETSLAEVETNRRMLETRLKGLRTKVEAQPKASPSAALSTPTATPPEIQRLRAQLSQLEAALLELRTKFTDQHPRVHLVQGRIAEVRAQLGDAVKETTAVSLAAGAVPLADRINFTEQLILVEASFHSAVAQEEALRRQAEALRRSLRGLSRGELDYTRLSREAESNRTLYAMLSEKLTAARIREQGEMKVVKIIDPAAFPTPLPNQKRMAFLAFALALAVGAGGAIPGAIEWFHRRVETEDDVDALTGLPVLAAIVRLRTRRPRFVGVYDTKGNKPGEHLMFTEAFRTLAVAIQLGGRTDRLRTLLVASAVAREGKSTVALNLSLALNEAAKRVVLADMDFERPTLHRTMEVENGGPGLVQTIQSKQPVDEALTPVRKGMWLAARGEISGRNTRGILAGARVGDLIAEMAEKADFVICDSSPVLLIPDGLLLAGVVDGVILVVNAGTTECRDLVKAKALLEDAGGRILGVVINSMPPSAMVYSYARYHHSYMRRETR